MTVAAETTNSIVACPSERWSLCSPSSCWCRRSFPFIFGIDAFDGSYDDAEFALATRFVPDGAGALIATVLVLLLGWADPV